MRTLFHAYSEEYGECEGIFDSDGTLLGFWACNDATWRNEYFEGFMRSLGFKVEDAPDWIQEKLDKIARDGF